MHELTDGIRLGQRRSFSRAPLALPATLRLPDGDVATTTRDVSAGGAGVAHEGAVVPDGPFELAIQVAHHEVVAQVSAVRVTEIGLGLRFERWRATTVSCSPRWRSHTTAAAEQTRGAPPNGPFRMERCPVGHPPTGRLQDRSKRSDGGR